MVDSVEEIDRLQGLEGITMKLHQTGLIPENPDYTTIWVKVHELVPEISLPSFDTAEISTDSTGLKTRNAGVYRVFKYGDRDARQKKHLMVVISADVRHKKLLCVDARMEGKGYKETSIAMERISFISERSISINKFYGEGVFDRSILFEKLHSLGAKPVMKIRKNATDWYKGGKYRRNEVRVTNIRNTIDGPARMDME